MSIVITLSPDTEQRLARLAEQAGQSKAWHVENMIKDGLQDMEDLAEAEAVLQRIRSGKEQVFSSAAVRAELGLDD